VEAWLQGINLARASRAKIRNVLCVLFIHVCRHELFDRNPIRSRQVTIGCSPVDYTTGEGRIGEQQLCPLHPAGCRKAGYSKAHRVAYVSPHLLHVAQKPWSRIQSHAGADEAFLAALFARRIHAGGWPSEAGRASRSAFAVRSATGFTKRFRDYWSGVVGRIRFRGCKKDTKM